MADKRSVVYTLERSWPTISICAAAQLIGISLALGIMYGIYPALKASRLEPVEALRSAA